MIPNHGSFGKCCAGSFVDENLILNNSGRCEILVTGIASSRADFQASAAISYRLAIGGGDSL
jgi:hypothetical protein